MLLSLGRYYLSSFEELGPLLEKVEPGDELPVGLLRVDRRGKARMTGVITAR